MSPLSPGVPAERLRSSHVVRRGRRAHVPLPASRYLSCQNTVCPDVPQPGAPSPSCHQVWAGAWQPRGSRNSLLLPRGNSSKPPAFVLQLVAAAAAGARRGPGCSDRRRRPRPPGSCRTSAPARGSARFLGSGGRSVLLVPAPLPEPCPGNLASRPDAYTWPSRGASLRAAGSVHCGRTGGTGAQEAGEEWSWGGCWRRQVDLA